MLVERGDEIRNILEYTERIAVVGCSPDESKPSYYVPAFLQGMGYRVIPVNSDHEQILGEKCYASLLDISEPVDMVECFRSSRDISGIAEDAIAIGAKVLWTQLGVINQQAGGARIRCRTQGYLDRCSHIKIHRFFDVD